MHASQLFVLNNIYYFCTFSVFSLNENQAVPLHLQNTWTTLLNCLCILTPFYLNMALAIFVVLFSLGSSRLSCLMAVFIFYLICLECRKMLIGGILFILFYGVIIIVVLNTLLITIDHDTNIHGELCSIQS